MLQLAWWHATAFPNTFHFPRLFLHTTRKRNVDKKQIEADSWDSHIPSYLPTLRRGLRRALHLGAPFLVYDFSLTRPQKSVKNFQTRRPHKLLITIQFSIRKCEILYHKMQNDRCYWIEITHFTKLNLLVWRSFFVPRFLWSGQSRRLAQLHREGPRFSSNVGLFR